MVRIPINGIHLNVEVAGSGPTVMAVHGFAGSALTWGAFIAAARADFTVLTVDMLGHGGSDALGDPYRYRMERCIQNLAALLDHFGIDRAHWLGYSMGGRIALSAAVALPKRTYSVVAESASPGLSTTRERSDRVRQDEALADWIEEGGIERFVEYWEALPLFASQARLSSDQRDKLRGQRLRNTPSGLANSLRGIGTGAQPPLHRKLRSLQAPALFIAGEEDEKFAEVAQEMHQAVPGSRLHIIPQAGHAGHLEQHEQFNRAVLDFLADYQPPLAGPVQSFKLAARSQQSR